MTIIIIAITVFISVLSFNNQTVYRQLIFNPYLVKHHNQWYRMVTSGFQHADYLHLFVNMFVLYSFGNAVEFYYDDIFESRGSLAFILLYLTSIFAANVSTLNKHQNNSGYNALGASGAVSAVVFTSILFNPLNKIYLYGIIGVPGIILGVLYLGYSWYMGKQQQRDNINHEAHFYGAIYGILFTLVFEPKVFLVFINSFSPN